MLHPINLTIAETGASHLFLTLIGLTMIGPGASQLFILFCFSHDLHRHGFIDILGRCGKGYPPEGLEPSGGFSL